MAKKKVDDDDRYWYVIVAGINDLVRYTTPCAKREVRGLLRNRPHLEGRIEVVPA